LEVGGLTDGPLAPGRVVPFDPLLVPPEVAALGGLAGAAGLAPLPVVGRVAEPPLPEELDVGGRTTGPLLVPLPLLAPGRVAPLLVTTGGALVRTPLALSSYRVYGRPADERDG
jgi:hypothetical protein